MGDASKFRLFAAGIDNLLALILAFVPAAKLPGLADPVRWAIALALYLAYFVVQEGLFSTTVGKRLFGLKVVRVDGSPSQWREAALRTLLRVVEVNPFLAGGLPAGLAIIFTSRKQRIGDLAASTIVIRPGA